MDKGLAAYQKAIELKPDDPSFHNNYALALVKNKKLPEAQAELTKAAQLDPTNAGKYYYNMGAVLVNSGQMDEPAKLSKRPSPPTPTTRPLNTSTASFWSPKPPPPPTAKWFRRRVRSKPSKNISNSTQPDPTPNRRRVCFKPSPVRWPQRIRTPTPNRPRKRKRISATGFKSGASFPITADGPLCGNPFPNKPSHTEDQHFSLSPPRSRFLPPSFSSCIISLRRAHDLNPVRPAFCISVGRNRVVQRNRFAETQRTSGEGSQERVAIAAVLHRIRQSRV